MELAGHEFLAALGKSRLRPGGKEGTEFLLNNCPIQENWQVLEVACNRGYNLIDLAQRFNCHLVGLDQSEQAISLAKENIKQANLTKQCQVVVGDACKLPFSDNSFDLVLNEAMLTMLPTAKKLLALQEYKRILKNGGYLLTHDLALDESSSSLQKELAQTIKHIALPLSLERWQDLLQEAGFEIDKYKIGKMSLLSPLGLMRDEGFFGALHIAFNGLKKENRQQFLTMFKFFHKQRHKLQYVAFVARK